MDAMIDDRAVCISCKEGQSSYEDYTVSIGSLNDRSIDTRHRDPASVPTWVHC